MARPLRIQFSGGLYHVTARGDGRQTLFLDDIDCERFLEVLGGVVTRYHLCCHAYCLMGNHYHLLLETRDPNLSRAMRQLNGRFAQHFNRRHDRPGHVMQGRYHAQVVDRDTYMREVGRYIVLNPVRAGLVGHPREWAWSSYRATAGEASPPGFLTVERILSLVAGSSRDSAEDQYARFVLAGIDAADDSLEPPRALVLGDVRPFADVRAQIERAAPLVDIPRVQRFALRPALEQIFAEVSSRADRDACCARAVVESGYTLRAVASFLGLHYSAVSRALERARSRPSAMTPPSTPDRQECCISRPDPGVIS